MNETICIHCIHVESILVACRIHPCRVLRNADPIHKSLGSTRLATRTRTVKFRVMRPLEGRVLMSSRSMSGRSQRKAGGILDRSAKSRLLEGSAAAHYNPTFKEKNLLKATAFSPNGTRKSSRSTGSPTTSRWE